MSDAPLQVIALLIFKDNEVLLVRHTNSKHIEGIYGLPGGKLEKGESEAEGAKRELHEETGLVADVNDLLPLPTLWKADVTFKDGSVRTCSMRVFLCKHYSGELQGTDKEVPTWVPASEVGKVKLLPNVQEAIQEGISFIKTAPTFVGAVFVKD